MADPSAQQPVAAALRQGWPTPMATAVTALGLTQIIAWGTTLYALGVLAQPIVAETGWSRSLVFAGLTIGLIASGLVSAPIGRASDRFGGRAVMSAGSLLAAAGLVLLAQARSEMTYLLAWAVLGPAMRMTLYDAAFAALVEVAPSRGRRAISYLTLFGGFASSVFWPIGHLLAAEIGWRGTCLVYAGLHVALCLPLHWWGLARREVAAATAPDPAAPTGAAAAPVLTGRLRTVALGLFALATSATAFVFGAMAVHLPPLLEAHGLTAAVAVTLASIKGFAQVAGRVCDILWGKNLHPIDLGRIAMVFNPLAFAALILGGASFAAALAFTLAFGIANGLVTIVRGAVPLALFGKQGYGALLGMLATPYLILNALAPTVLAVVVDTAGYPAAELLLLTAGLVGWLAIEALAAWYRRLQRAAAG